MWTRHAPGARRRHLHDGAGHAAGGRLLHLPRVDRRERGDRRRSRRRAARRRRRRSPRPPRRSRPSSRTRWSSPTRSSRHAEGHRPGQDAGDRQGRPVRPVRLARRHRLRRHAVLDGQGRRHRRRRVPVAQGHVRRVGFYVFRERIEGSETVAAAQAECAVEAETSLAAPLILGGRGDNVAEVRAVAGGRAQARQARPARASTRAVNAVGIDLKAGALGIPSDIKKVGWWTRRRGARRRRGHGPDRRPRGQREERRGRVLRAQVRPLAGTS